MSTHDTRIAKLPTWAREYIAKLERERDGMALSMKRLFDNERTEGPVEVEIYGTTSGGKFDVVSRFFDASRVRIKHAQVELTVHLAKENQPPFGGLHQPAIRDA